MATGTIKRIVRDRGFGFIKPEGKGDELFFHRTGLASGVDFDSLQEGERVSYDEEDSKKGPRATDIERA